MDRLLASGRLNEGKETYLDALSDLVADYEDEHHTIKPASDADMSFTSWKRSAFRRFT
jgi:hypothetical protein